MPVVPVDFKSDREIEASSKTTIKSRSYRSFQVDGLANCFYCSNIVWPTCDFGVEKPCDPKCYMVVDHKKIHEFCPHYSTSSCKEGYPVSTVEDMPCPKYDGPKINAEILFFGEDGKVIGTMKTK